MHQCFVGVYHLFQVDGLVAVVSESRIMIEILINFNYIFYRSRSLDDGGTEDSSGEVTTIGDEVDVGIERALYLFQTLTDFCDMLMLEWLIDAQVVVSPREMRGGPAPVEPVMALTATSSFKSPR